MKKDPQDPIVDFIYETYDFPVIVTNENGAHIDWLAYEETDVVKRLEKGISLTSEQAQKVTDDIHVLEELYNYRTDRLDWEQRSNGMLYLEAIFPDAGNGLWMYLFSKEGDHKGTPMEDILKPKTKVDTHNVDYASQAIFFVECLAAYYKQIGIQFPYIKANKSGVQKCQAGDHTIERITRNYSFEIPWNDTFDYQEILTNYTNNLGIKMAQIESDYLETQYGGKAQLITTPQGKIWVAQNLESDYDAVKLFRLLSIPLKVDPKHFR